MSKGQRACCWVVFLAVVIGASFHPGTSGSDPGMDQNDRPVLQSTESVPATGSYVLAGEDGKPCLKTSVGVEFMVAVNKTSWFYNLNPDSVNTSGSCHTKDSLLSLTLPGNTASLRISFTKGKTEYYVTKMIAHISPQPVCKNCDSKTYAGVVANEKLFQVASGRSYTCKSQSVFQMSSQLSIKLGPLQIQAFGVPNGQFGKEEECWADFLKRLIPIIAGSVVLAVVLIAILTFLLVRERRRAGYDRI